MLTNILFLLAGSAGFLAADLTYSDGNNVYTTLAIEQEEVEVESEDISVIADYGNNMIIVKPRNEQTCMIIQGICKLGKSFPSLEQMKGVHDLMYDEMTKEEMTDEEMQEEEMTEEEMTKEKMTDEEMLEEEMTKEEMTDEEMPEEEMTEEEMTKEKMMETLRAKRRVKIPEKMMTINMPNEMRSINVKQSVSRLDTLSIMGKKLCRNMNIVMVDISAVKDSAVPTPKAAPMRNWWPWWNWWPRRCPWCYGHYRWPCVQWPYWFYYNHCMFVIHPWW